MMTIRRTTAVAGLLACAAAFSLLPVASAGSPAAKQRVSFLVNFNVNTESASWELIPLTKGPLKRDSGSSTAGDTLQGSQTLLNGQLVYPLAGSDRLFGKRGTLVISQKLVQTQVSDEYTADIGTWKLVSGTGAYKSSSGGGRFAGVGLPGGTVLINQEGWVTIR